MLSSEQSGYWCASIEEGNNLRIIIMVSCYPRCERANSLSVSPQRAERVRDRRRCSHSIIAPRPPPPPPRPPRRRRHLTFNPHKHTPSSTGCRHPLNPTLWSYHLESSSTTSLPSHSPATPSVRSISPRCTAATQIAKSLHSTNSTSIFFGAGLPLRYT